MRSPSSESSSLVRFTFLCLFLAWIGLLGWYDVFLEPALAPNDFAPPAAPLLYGLALSFTFPALEVERTFFVDFDGGIERRMCLTERMPHKVDISEEEKVEKENICI